VIPDRLARDPQTAGLDSALRGLERRAFLRLLGLAASAGMLPSGCGPGPGRLGPPPGRTLRILSPRTYAVFTAATARIVGPDGAAAMGEGRIDPAGIADDWLERLPRLGALLSRALLALEFAIFPLVGKLRPFTALEPGDQDRILEELMRSRFEWKRAVFNGIKSMACLSFYASPASRALTGYPGPFGGDEVTIADAMRYGLEERKPEIQP
jgi:hypothetical protein